MSGRYPDAPVRRPVSHQRWEELTFLHWRYDAAVVQRLLPPELTAQEVDGSAWVALTPFRMSGVRPALVPAVPGWSTFPELNVRTYVAGPDGRDGLWFLRLTAPRRAVVVALRALGLPYVRADAAQWADGERWRYAFAAPGTHGRGDAGLAPGRLDAVVDVGAPLAEAARPAWLDSLTGRWTAFHRRAGRLWRTPVEHEPWPLRHATVTGDVVEPLLAVGLPAPDDEPVVHVSPGVGTRIGAPRPA